MTILYRGQGIVSVAEVGRNHLPLGFEDLGNCPKLEIRTTVNQQRHHENRTERNYADAVLETQQVSLSMTLDSLASQNMSRFFYGKLVPEESRLIQNEPVLFYRGRISPLNFPGVVDWQGLVNGDGIELIRRNDADTLVVLASYDGTQFNAPGHGLPDGRPIRFLAVDSPFQLGQEYRVFNPASDTFQVGLPGFDTPIAGGVPGEVIVQPIYDYSLNEKSGILGIPSSSRIQNGDRGFASYQFASLERLYGMFKPSKPVMLLFSGVNLDGVPVRVIVHRVKLGPSAWNLIGGDFSRVEVEGLIMPDHRQQQVTIEFGSNLVFPEPPPPPEPGTGFVNIFRDALADIRLNSAVLVGVNLPEDLDLTRAGFVNTQPPG